MIFNPAQFSDRSRIVSTAAGFRGAVSLAVALAVPLGVVGSDGRDMVVFVTAGVVVLSLLLQGAALPALIGWARIEPAGKGTLGAPEAGPFDRILVSADAGGVPSALEEQLAIGGRLVVPIGPAGKHRLRVIRRRKGDYAQEEGEDVSFVPLLGRFAGSPA